MDKLVDNAMSTLILIHFLNSQSRSFLKIHLQKNVFVCVCVSWEGDNAERKHPADNHENKREEGATQQESYLITMISRK